MGYFFNEKWYNGDKMEVNGMSAAARELKRPLLELRQLALGLGDLDGEINTEQVREIQAEMIEISERAIGRMEDLVELSRLRNFTPEREPVAVRAVCDAAIKRIVTRRSEGSGSLVREPEQLNSDFAQNVRQKAGQPSENLSESHKQGTGKRYYAQMYIKYSNRARLAVGNSKLLEKIIYNLLIDAKKYAIYDPEYNTRAELGVRDFKEKIEIRVRDFGPAIPFKTWQEIQGVLRTPGSEILKTPGEIAMRPESSALGFFSAVKFAKEMDAELGMTRHRDGTSFFLRLPALKQSEIILC